MRTTQVVVVHWLDAYSSPEHEPGKSGWPQVSAGVLIERNKQHVKLALIVARDNGADGVFMRDVMTIPRGMVTSIKVVHRERRKTV